MNFFKQLYFILCLARSLYLKSIDFFKSYIFKFFDYINVTRFKLDEYLLSNVLFLDLYYSNNKNWKLRSLYFLELFKSNCYSVDYIYYWSTYIYLNRKKTKSFLSIRNYHIINKFTTFLKQINILNLKCYINLRLKNLYMSSLISSLLFQFTNMSRRSFGFGFTYLVGFMFVLFIDACITDDEPLWEPIEWSLVQSWILFIFIFAWIAENLIVSRYGSYTGRDKRVWMSWYKTFWMIEGFYILNYGIVCVFVIVPFYYETNYNLSFVYSWWHWYTRIFFFKFISIYAIVLLIANVLQISVRWVNWKKSLFLIILINIFLSYLIYTHFIITFFGYFTDPIWYQKVRPIDYIQLSHEPAKWGWGSAKKDHFTYHNVKTVFWFKNDGPFASSFLLFHLFLFVCLFLTYFWWITLFRKVFSTKEVPITYLTYCISSLRQFFYFFLWMYIFILLSYISNYWRFPIDMSFMLNTESWLQNFIRILLDYPYFLICIFFK
jgi:hypothetical protein